MFIDLFIDNLRVERKYSAHTLRSYFRDLRQFQEYIRLLDENLELRDVDSDIVRTWVVSLMEQGSFPTTVNRKMSALRSFYAFLRNEGIIKVSPMAGVHGPKCPKRLPAFVKEQEMADIVEKKDFGSGFVACRNKAIIACFYETGIRLSELVGLNVGDVDFSASVIKVLGKRNKHRLIPLMSELRSLIEEYMDVRAVVAVCDEKALFVTQKGVRINTTAVYRIVNKCLKESATVAKNSPHVLRHTFATAMLNNDAELGAVKELLGHSKLATTEIYTHLTFEELKRFYKKAHPRADNN